jgi:hypothetical protein
MQRTTHQKDSQGRHQNSSHRKLNKETQTPLSKIMIMAIFIFSIGCIQAAPLFDFLPPVIIDEDQHITSNNYGHTTIFYPIGK